MSLNGDNMSLKVVVDGGGGRIRINGREERQSTSEVMTED